MSIRSIVLVSVSLLSFVRVGFSTECPKKIKVEVTKVESVRSKNIEKINEFFVAGEGQTHKAYIQEVLKVAENLGEPTDTLKYAKKSSDYNSTCYYQGKHTTLTIKPVSYDPDKGYTAVLRLGEIDYESPDVGSNPSAHKGKALDLTTHLLTLSKTEIVAARNKKSILSFDLEIQIPLGDYGTDGFTETVHVGKAWVNYSIAE